jgi:hypothetical protein
MSSDASASTDSNTYYEDDFSSTEEDSSQGSSLFFPVSQRYASMPQIPLHHFVFTYLVWTLILCALNGVI